MWAEKVHCVQMHHGKCRIQCEVLIIRHGIHNREEDYNLYDVMVLEIMFCFW